MRTTTTTNMICDGRPPPPLIINVDVQLLCAMDMISNLCGVSIPLSAMNLAIDHIKQRNLAEDLRRLERRGHPGGQLPHYGTRNQGKLADRVIVHLIQTHCHCDVVKIDLATGKAGIGGIRDLLAVLGGLPHNAKIYVVGWAGSGRFDLDGGVAHAIGITRGLLVDGHKKPAAVSATSLGAAYHGIDITRLKAYELRPQQGRRPAAAAAAAVEVAADARGGRARRKRKRWADP